MRLHLNLVGFLVYLLAPTLQICAFRSSGNCSLAYEVPFKFVCKGKVTKDLQTLFRDYRAPPETPYSVWHSEADDFDNDGVSMVLITFYSPKLSRFDSIILGKNGFLLSQFFLGTSGNGTYQQVIVSPSTLHCFPFNLRYPSELERHCLGKGLGDGDEVAKKPILFYGSLAIKIPEVPMSGARTFSLLRALLVVVCAETLY
ncbi:uncharacterized protein LOC108030728 [Drosophila biarmipes]|uniref:uncharacterized protein LOC108030728 n=1 Tax=Drosophila biarmipes TaxID=125945 RepID=UPI0007E77E8E|nr:uncharacterized protein LOC108030728 [Drosophila biarmipes]